MAKIELSKVEKVKVLEVVDSSEILDIFKIGNIVTVVIPFLCGMVKGSEFLVDDFEGIIGRKI